jgi:site-specific recombinase XerD
MLELIETFRKELLQLALFADDTVRNYVSCLYKFVEYAEGELKIDPIQAHASHLRQWMTHLKQTDISYSRMIHHQSALKNFFSLLENLGVIDKNPTEALFAIPKVKSDRNQPIPKETAFKLLRSIDRTSWLGERNFMIISMLWALGLRREELTALKIRDFDPNYDPDNKIGLLIIHGKGKKQRALFVVDKLYDNLLNYLSQPQSPRQTYQPMFPTQAGNAISGHRVLMLLRQAAQKAGIKERVTPHVLRHSFATEMYQAKAELDAIQDMMGHDNIAETAIYIHVPDKLKQQALEQITINGKVSWP